MPNQPKPHTTVVVRSIPECDICADSIVPQHGVPAYADGKTRMGPWANMCKRHFQSVGVGLGLGKGQKFILEER